MNGMKTKALPITVFILSLLTLVISLKLFLNLSVYADEYGSSPILVDGGMFWLCMDWLRLLLLLSLCVASGIGILRGRRR